MRAALLAIVAATACSSPPSFVCETNVDCVSETGEPGICESNGSCTFADSTCPTTNRRYPDGASGSLASQCLAPEKSCVSQLAVGSSHSCALRSDGTVWCWGLDDEGQVGTAGADQTTPVEVLRLPSGHLATAVTAGENFACALIDNGTVWCWGGDGAKQLGQCTMTPPESSSTPLEVITYAAGSPPTCNANNPFHAKQISAGGQHACAIGVDDKLYCWGENQVGAHGGQAGQDPLVFDDVPGPLALAFDGAVEVQAGDEYSCVVKDEHSVWCFGANTLGELGTGGTTDSFTPVNVPGLADAESLVIDDETACIQTRDGALWCWGNGTTGIFGANLSDNVLSPARITTAAKAYGGGTAETICLGQNDGVVECFGANDSAQAAVDGDANITMPTPAPLVTVTSASLGADHSCAVTTDGAIWCWGDNSHGQLGNGTTSDAPTPIPTRVTWSCP